MNIISYKIHKMPMIWGTLVLVMGLLYACSDVDSSEDSTPIPIHADDITYDKDRIAQGIVDAATPSSTIADLSILTFSIAPISLYVGTGTHELPTIEKDGTITTATTTSAGSYRVTITPDSSIFTGDPLTVDFYVTVKPADTAELDTTLEQAITDYGLTGDLNYIDTSAVTDMSYLFKSGSTPGTGEEDATRTYVEGFNGDISKWDVSAVEDFSSMFFGATAFNQDLSGWGVDSTDTTTGMFKDSGVVSLPDWYAPTPIHADDITYDKDRIAQGIVDTATPSSLTIADLSILTFSIALISPYVGAGTHEPPTIGEDGIITTATTTSAGSYRVTITADGSTFSGTLTVDFYVTVKPADTAELDTMLEQAITDYGLAGDFNYIDTSAVTDMSYLFRSGYTPGTGEEDATRTYVEGFNGDISKWDVSAVEDFSSMFDGATAFNQNLSSWSVDSTDTTTGMFKDSGVVSLPDWYAPILIRADDITYDKDRIAQGIVDTATPSSLTIADLSILTFSITLISPYVGTGTHELPTIGEDGIITTATTTSAGSYRVTITPDGRTFTGDPIIVDFYMTVKPADTAELDTMLKQAITDYGLAGDFNYIDTSVVTDMSYLFRSGYTPGTGEEDATRTYVEGFNGDISKWDVSAVEDFSSMFFGATAFNQDISSWTVSTGQDFGYMFYKATMFNQDLSGWSVDSTDTTISMFKDSGMVSFPDWYAPTPIYADDITYDKDRIAQGIVDTATPSSSTIIDFSDLIFSIALISPYVGTGTHEPPTIAEDGIITAATTTNAGSYRVTITPDGSIFTGDSFTVDFYVTVKPANIAELDTMLEQAITDYGLTGDFNYIDTSVVTDMSYLFRSGYTLGTGEEDATRTYVEGFNGDISKWDVSAVTDFSNMFNGATAFNQNISSWTVSTGQDFGYMFYKATTFNQDLSGWGVDSTDTTISMFKDSGVVSLPDWYAPTPIHADDITYDKDSIAQGTVGTATPSSLTITDFSDLIFSIALISPYVGTGTHEPPTIAEGGIITTATTTSAGSYRVTITPDGSIFTGDSFTVDFYVTVKPADILELDTMLAQAITDYGLTGDFNYIDTSLVTIMTFLFASGYTPGVSDPKEDSGRTYIANFNGDISKWDVSAVTNFGNMFWNTTAFNQDIGGWDVSSGQYFYNMFEGAAVFNQDIGGWTVSAGQYFTGMFLGAIAFNQDISRWIVTAGQYFISMFEGATAFNQDVSSWNLDPATDTITNMFLNSGVTNPPSWYTP